jgi:hypothetical protein
MAEALGTVHTRGSFRSLLRNAITNSLSIQPQCGNFSNLAAPFIKLPFLDFRVSFHGIRYRKDMIPKLEPIHTSQCAPPDVSYHETSFRYQERDKATRGLLLNFLEENGDTYLISVDRKMNVATVFSVNTCLQRQRNIS